jgi:hypothetical protein
MLSTAPTLRVDVGSRVVWATIPISTSVAMASSTEWEVPDMNFPCLVFDLSFHPTQDAVAVGLVNGKVEL